MTTNVLPGTQHEGADCGPGLWRRFFADGSSVVTNIRMAGTARKRGSLLINAATALLLILAIALYVVSINAQFAYVMHVKHDDLVSWIEAASLDGGMAVFTLLALGLARAGQTARIERLAIVACAFGSAVMNWAAASTVDVRSELAYTIPPLFLAGVVDRTVSVIRRHYLGDEDASAWSNLGKVSLYTLRLVVAPPSTVTGLRRVLLERTPLPAKPKPEIEQPEPEPLRLHPMLELPAGKSVPWPRQQQPQRPSRNGRKLNGATRTGRPSKTKAFLATCENKYGALAAIELTNVYKIANEIAPEHELHPGSARSALRSAILKARAL
jgi:hypothetical protein